MSNRESLSDKPGGLKGLHLSLSLSRTSSGFVSDGSSFLSEPVEQQLLREYAELNHTNTEPSRLWNCPAWKEKETDAVGTYQIIDLAANCLRRTNNHWA